MTTSKKKCRHCKKYDYTDDMLNINGGYFCDIDCATSHAFKNKEKGKKIKYKQQKKDFNISDTKKQHELTQPVFNRMRVLQEKKWFYDRGLEPECISCGKTNMDWCCGHFKTRGSQANLRYDEKNTYLQCNRYCNMALSGNISGNKTTRGYAAGLFVRFGEDATAIIDYLESNVSVKKWTGEELVELRKKFSEEIRRLQKEIV